MEKLGGGGATGLRHHRSPPSSERFLGICQSASPSSSPPLELSEHDIFSSPAGSSCPSPTHPHFNPNPSATLKIQKDQNHCGSHNGILAALNDNLKTGSGTDTRPVFNHKASTSASLSSSSSTSPVTLSSSRIMIPRRPPPPPVDRMRLHHQSAPVNIPMMPMAMRKKDKNLDAIVSEDEEKDQNGVFLPPHEMIAARHSPMLSCSVLEGAGRTLKGRDLRQVRNAIWRKTGFID